MGESTDGCLTHLVQVFTERYHTVWLTANHQCIDKKTNHPFQLAPIPVCDRRTHCNVFLPAVAVQQRFKTGKKGHVQGRSGLDRQCLECIGQLFSQNEALGVSVKCLRCRARPVGRKLQDGRLLLEDSFPIGKLFFQFFSLQILPLPIGKIGVVQIEVRQR